MSTHDMIFPAKVLNIDGPFNIDGAQKIKITVQYSDGRIQEVWAGGSDWMNQQDVIYVQEQGLNGTINVKWLPSRSNPGDYVQYVSRPRDWSPSQQSSSPPPVEQKPMTQVPPGNFGPPASSPISPPPQQESDEPVQPPPQSKAITPADLSPAEVAAVMKSVRVAAVVATHAVLLSESLMPQVEPVEGARLIRDFLISADRMAPRAEPNGAIMNLPEVRQRMVKRITQLEKNGKALTAPEESALETACTRLQFSQAVFGKELAKLSEQERYVLWRWISQGTGMIREEAIVALTMGG